MWGALLSGGAAIVGALINKKSTSSTNKQNARSIAATNAYNKNESAQTRAFNLQQIESQRAYDYEQQERAYFRDLRAVQSAQVYDRSQVLDQRRYDAAQSIAAEKRGRAYLAEDRDYSSPANTRARLEDAGINPLSMLDPSNAVAGSGAFVSGQASIASSQIARATAAQSGISQASSFSAIAPQFQASTFGSDIASAGVAVANSIQADQEYALRQTQIQMENQRLNAVLQRSTLQPIVPGPYGPTQRTTRATVAQNTHVPDTSGPTSVRVFGHDVRANPNFSDAEIAEQRYGEVGGAVYGLGVIGADIKSELSSLAQTSAPSLALAGQRTQRFLDDIQPVQSDRRDLNWEADPDAQFYGSFNSRPQRTVSQMMPRSPIVIGRPETVSYSHPR